MLSGIIRISLYPLMAATMASAIPVLPDVASMRVSPGLITPLASAAAILVVKFQVESDQGHAARIAVASLGSWFPRVSGFEYGQEANGNFLEIRGQDSPEIALLVSYGLSLTC